MELDEADGERSVRRYSRLFSAVNDERTACFCDSASGTQEALLAVHAEFLFADLSQLMGS